MIILIMAGGLGKRMESNIPKVLHEVYHPTNSEIQYDKLSENYNYLSEVQKETTNNYNQIEDAATTLLDILKSKCDNMA